MTDVLELGICSYGHTVTNIRQTQVNRVGDRVCVRCVIKAEDERAIAFWDYIPPELPQLSADALVIIMTPAGCVPLCERMAEFRAAG